MSPQRDESTKSNLAISPQGSYGSPPSLLESSSPTNNNSPGNPDDFLCLEVERQSDCAPRCNPTWVARPRNAFIIFRCEYARRHSRMGKRVKRTGAPADKSLSKRAAEAWHQLSNGERDHFKTLAEQERIEHARMHPDYRFRPMKRLLPKKCSPRPRAVSMSNAHQRCETSDIVKKEAEVGQCSVPPVTIMRKVSRTVLERDLCQSSSLSYPTQEYGHSADSKTLPFYPPDLSGDQYPFTEPWFESQLCSSVHSVSHMRAPKHLSASPDFDVYDPHRLSLASPQERVLPPSSMFNVAMNPCIFEHITPFTVSCFSSSLANWNGSITEALSFDPRAHKDHSQSPRFSPGPPKTEGYFDTNSTIEGSTRSSSYSSRDSSEPLISSSVPTYTGSYAPRAADPANIHNPIMSPHLDSGLSLLSSYPARSPVAHEQPIGIDNTVDGTRWH
ncbi:hypothetical protein AX17_004526 [Amanita inopinata Kibby_2008]|nr:hypothetical protein AX17_004526 [Amanita inopinata Kibby_2008]